MSAGTTTGALYLVPTPLAAMQSIETLPEAVLQKVAALDYFVAENAKSARAFLKGVATRYPLAVPLQSIEIAVLDVSTPAEALPALLEPLLRGRDAALVSEAGAPAVADPGARLIARAHLHGIAVRPLVGPSAILLALMASGMNGQRFAFHGYLPVDASARRLELKRLERESRASSQTQIVIETPYRNDVFLKTCVDTLDDTTTLCIAVNLSASDESVQSRSIKTWKNSPLQPLKGRPAVFLLLAA